jgi:hypothetical protein
MKKLISALATAGALVSASAAHAATVHVANNGIDTPVCGAVGNPCRSITQGIANAAAGDTVLVRPGRYGDIDGSGAIDRPGEEKSVVPFGSTVGVYVNKRVTVLSTDGAGATLIDMGNATEVGVEVAVNGARFGERDAGFAVTRARALGIAARRVTEVVVAGNIAANLPVGFALTSSGTLVARDNTATGNGTGFSLTSANLAGFVTLANNVATTNDTGIAVGPTAGHRVSGNRVSYNGVGLNVAYGASILSSNRVTGNERGVRVGGFATTDGPLANAPLLQRNHLVGNRVNGVDVFSGPAGAMPLLRENNIFGNGQCGTTNQSQFVLDARNNYWGAPTGPSFQDPADPACPNRTLTTPFAVREFVIP